MKQKNVTPIALLMWIALALVACRTSPNGVATDAPTNIPASSTLAATASPATPDIKGTSDIALQATSVARQTEISFTTAVSPTETPGPICNSFPIAMNAPSSIWTSVYETDFDDLTPGKTFSFPGASGHDGWYEDFSASQAFGEIQSTLARSGQALQEFKDSSARRNVAPPNLVENPFIILQVDFYVSSDDPADRVNEIDAFVGVFGGSPLDPDANNYEILGLKVISGPGSDWSQGVDIELNAYNERDKRYSFRPHVGRDLAWDAWHTVTLIADHGSGSYVSLTVDCQTDQLSDFMLPLDDVDPSGIWTRGNKMKTLLTHIIQPGGFESQLDHVYWDNLSLVVGQADYVASLAPGGAPPPPGPSPTAHCAAGWSRLSPGIFAEVAQNNPLPNRVRSAPDTDAEIILLIYPGHTFFVLEGPVCADGLVFWLVESAAIPGGQGWTAEGDGKEYWLVPKAP